MLLHYDLRWITALCYVALGLGFTVLAFWIWMMPIYKRAVVFEPYLTPRGVETLLQSWPLTFVIGVFLIVSGLSRWAYYSHGGRVLDNLTLGVGTLEALFSFWAASSVIVVAVRMWRGD